MSEAGALNRIDSPRGSSYDLKLVDVLSLSVGSYEQRWVSFPLNACLHAIWGR